MSYFNPKAPSNRLDWRLFTVQFTAISPTTNNTFFDGSAANNFISPLDNVSLTAVAVLEPATVILGVMGLGMGGVVIYARRKKASVRRKRVKTMDRAVTISSTQ